MFPGVFLLTFPYFFDTIFSYKPLIGADPVGVFFTQENFKEDFMDE